MSIQQAAQSALDVQYACNLSGVARSLDTIIQETLWPEARRLERGTPFVNKHPIVAMYLLKMAELNGCGDTMHPAYEEAEKACRELAMGAEVKA